MQTSYTGFIDRSEWRWVSLVSVTFVLVALIPYLLVALFAADPSNYQFMGTLHDHVSTAAGLTRMQQGASGQFLLEFLYSSQDQNAMIIHPLYALTGQLTTYTDLSITTIFHVLRIFVSLFMYMAIYFLGANIWVKTRPRRIFFVLASASAGFGWLLSLIFTILDNRQTIPDLTLPQLFPMFAASANIHYPLAIACVAILASVIIPVLRPGDVITPAVNNGAAIIFGASLVLALVYPDALLPLSIGYIGNVCINWMFDRKSNINFWYWGLWLLVPALPIVAYDIISFINNPQLANWIQQRGDLPNIFVLFASLGFLLVLALPGLFRALRRFERDGDRFMLLWLVAMLITAYLPLQLKQYLLLGITLPVAYFATRSVEDFWLNSIRRRYRPRVYLIVFPILILSHIVWMFLPVYPVVAGWHGINAMVIERDYTSAFKWLDANTSSDTVIMASEHVSLWIPAYTGARVVYGHPEETFMASNARNDVIRWYQTATDCLTTIDQYGVDYILYGEHESVIGKGDCLDNFEPVREFDDLTIYRIQNDD